MVNTVADRAYAVKRWMATAIEAMEICPRALAGGAEELIKPRSRSEQRGEQNSRGFGTKAKLTGANLHAKDEEILALARFMRKLAAPKQHFRRYKRNNNLKELHSHETRRIHTSSNSPHSVYGR